ncbi:MAG: GNAT family N-acetyltransferase [Chloroflexi bacterium]|nr:GNAT family N-acetyltransferase [Chloroflexota bacterium]MBP8055687.1 GNAT family N-acetyltransferase [Chloroflexota bacterium]
MTRTNLPIELGDGLVMRWGRADDAEALAEFNVRIHSDDAANPDRFLGYWTRDLLSGKHPTTGPEDFTIVVDEKAGGKIVSSLCLISQTWLYEDMPFGCGRVELVGTDEAYRRRGLVARQFEVIHALSASKGETVQGITGIPWYYRQFGYEMALDLHGSALFFWSQPGNDVKVEQEMYRWRAAADSDIPLLQQLYPYHTQKSLINRQRTETLWRHEMNDPHEDSPYRRRFHIIETNDGQPVAYAEYNLWREHFILRELGVLPGHSWRAVTLFVTRALKAEAERLNPQREHPITNILFDFGPDHPTYDVLGEQLQKPWRPYAWYMRVADLPGFLRHIGPVLERRLAASFLAGHSGSVHLNLYRQMFTLTFHNGQLAEIVSFNPKRLEEGDARFPDLTFLQLLFGRCSLAELRTMFADCYASNEATILLNVLFPQRHSQVIGLG